MSLAECRTAEEVRELARRIAARKRQQCVAAPIVDHTPKPAPLEVIEPPEPCRIRNHNSLPFWRHVVGTPEHIDPCPSIGLIQAVIGRRYKIKYKDLVSARRFAPATRARQIAMYLARSETTRTFPQIGRMFGGRDHTTALHAYNKFAALRESDPAVDAEIAELIGQLYQEMKT